MSRVSTDGLVRGLVQQHDLKVSVAVVTQAARTGREKHELHTAAAGLLGQSLAGAALLASLQKDGSRINFQLACDGPVRGVFVDASANGDVRGYVKNPLADVLLTDGPYRWRAALGNAGYISVLRDIGGGEYYRSSVELSAMQLADDLNHYFDASEQVATRLAIESRTDGDEPLGVVAGVLVQALPNGDAPLVHQLGNSLPAALSAALEREPAISPTALLTTLFADYPVDVTFTGPVQWRCTCGKARVLETLATLGADEVQSMLDTDGTAAVVCQFCATRHVATFDDLVGILKALGRAGPTN